MAWGRRPAAILAEWSSAELSELMIYLNKVEPWNRPDVDYWGSHITAAIGRLAGGENPPDPKEFLPDFIQERLPPMDPEVMAAKLEWLREATSGMASEPVDRREIVGPPQAIEVPIEPGLPRIVPIGNASWPLG